ncbi:hypothetical protein [uncultured Treponema sp.]|uniref:hypothetical protein n=1 Tax=uncultured Treponema sp. TaxID=162155 RepID=UPI0025FDA252|nr:hypothetical protein [uncultured Treponema sp.]
MKKISFFAFISTIFLILASCGTTENVSQPSQEPQINHFPEETSAKIHEEVANAIADEMNSAMPAQEKESPATQTVDVETGAEDNAENSVSPLSEPAEEVPAENQTTEKTAISEIGESSENNESAVAIETEEVSETESQNKEISEETISEEDFSEKVSEEDSNLTKEREEAPTTDERGRISEYQIFEEPEVLVLDLPEKETETIETAEPVQTEENQSEESLAVNEPESETIELSEATPVESAEKPEPIANTKQDTTPAEKAPSQNSKQENKEKGEDTGDITPSRSVAVKINQYLDVTYPGKGWSYIGETEGDSLFNYFGRKLGSANTTFSLRAKKAGNTILHFYKDDSLTGEYIDDYLAVTVETKKSAGRVKAPSYADIVPAKPQRRIERANETNPQIQTAKSATKENELSSETEKKQADDNKKNTITEATVKPTENSNDSVKKQTEKAPQKKEISEKKEAPSAKETAVSSNNKESVKPQPSKKEENTAHSVNSVPHIAPENDVKTVIQTTDTPVPAKPALPPKTVNAPPPQISASVENFRQEQESNPSQVYNYTPTSSESSRSSKREPGNITFEENSLIQNEPFMFHEEQDVKVDESLLEQALKDFEAQKYEIALDEAEQYFNSASTRLDEALYLLGQIWESESEVKNIRSSVDSYDTLVKLYPASKFWKKAKNRSIYLKRFYIDIR